MTRRAIKSPFRRSRTSMVYVPWASVAMICAKRLLSELERSAITEPGGGGSQSGPEQPTRAMAAAKMLVENLNEKCIMMTIDPSNSVAYRSGSPVGHFLPLFLMLNTIFSFSISFKIIY